MNNALQSAFGFVDNRSSSYEDNEVHYGLTKREYFAAMAMQGMLANIYSTMGQYEMELPDVAHDSVKAADDLLKQLSL